MAYLPRALSSRIAHALTFLPIVAMAGMPASGLEDDTYLIPVQYDVYLGKENPLTRFAVNQ